MLKVCDHHETNSESCRDRPVEAVVNLLFVPSSIQTASQRGCFGFSFEQEEVPEGMVN